MECNGTGRGVWAHRLVHRVIVRVLVINLAVMLGEINAAESAVAAHEGKPAPKRGGT